jgi:hypothetical protein
MTEEERYNIQREALGDLFLEKKDRTPSKMIKAINSFLARYPKEYKPYYNINNGNDSFTKSSTAYALSKFCAEEDYKFLDLRYFILHPFLCVGYRFLKGCLMYPGGYYPYDAYTALVLIDKDGKKKVFVHKTGTEKIVPLYTSLPKEFLECLYKSMVLNVLDVSAVNRVRKEAIALYLKIKNGKPIYIKETNYRYKVFKEISHQKDDSFLFRSYAVEIGEHGNLMFSSDEIMTVRGFAEAYEILKGISSRLISYEDAYNEITYASKTKYQKLGSNIEESYKRLSMLKNC